MKRKALNKCVLYLALISMMFNTLGTLSDVSANSSEAILENNTYIISMNKDMSEAFYLPSKDQGAYIKRGGSIGNQSDQARYNLTHLGDNKYKIESVFSGLSWRVKGESKNDNAKIIQSTYINDVFSQFYIEEYQDAYRIRNVYSNKLISPSGKDVVQHSSPKSSKIYIQKSHILEEGRYTLSTKGTGMTDNFYAPNLKVGATIARGGSVVDLGDATTWTLSHISNGRYRIQNQASKLYMAVKDYATSGTADVIQVQETLNKNALFNIEKNSDGFNIRNVNSGKFIGPDGSKVVQSDSFINSKILIKRLEKTDDIESGIYTIDLGSENDLLYSSNDIWGSQISRNGKIDKGNSAKWNIQKYNNQLYRIQNVETGLFLSVAGDSNNDNAKIIQVRDNAEQLSQLWTITRTSGTSYRIKNAKSHGLLTGNNNDVVQHKNPKTKTVELMPIFTDEISMVLHSDEVYESGYYPENSEVGAEIKVGGSREQHGDLIHWKLEAVKRNIYKFKNVKTGLYLDVKAESTADNAILIQSPKKNVSSQEFGIIAVDRAYQIYNVKSKKFLTNNGDTMIQSSKISPLSNFYIYEKEPLAFEEGEYMIYVSYFRNRDGNEVINSINDIYTNQKDSEIYNISNDTIIDEKDTKSYIDEIMTSTSLSSGDFVRATISSPIVSDARTWIIKEEEHGYTIQNKYSKLYLTSENDLLLQREKTGERNQVFLLERTGIINQLANIQSATGGYIMSRYGSHSAYALGDDQISFTVSKIN